MEFELFDCCASPGHLFIKAAEKAHTGNFHTEGVREPSGQAGSWGGRCGGATREGDTWRLWCLGHWSLGGTVGTGYYKFRE